MPRAPHLAAIALGSNLPSSFGSPADTLREAIRRIGALGIVARVSSFLLTAAEIYTAQPDFLNAALLLETALSPIALLDALLIIESGMGRVRTGVPPKGPRTIDLDLIFFDTITLHSPKLTLPHPALAARRFVLAPLAEVAPDWRHPATGLSVVEMLGSIGTY